MEKKDRYKTFYGETTPIALAKVPDDYEVIQVIRQHNFMSEYFEVVARLQERSVLPIPEGSNKLGEDKDD